MVMAGESILETAGETRQRSSPGDRGTLSRPLNGNGDTCYRDWSKTAT